MLLQYRWKYLLFASLLVLVFGALHLVSSLVRPIGGSSEAREAHVVSIITTGGEWVLPLRNGVVPSKPPLHHWIGAVIAHLTGSTEEWVARAPSIFFGMLALIFTMWIAKFLYRAVPYVDEDEAENVALLAGVILATTYGFSMLASDARVDMTFSALVIGAIGSGLYALLGRDEPASQRSEAQAMGFFFLFSGLAVVAKGPLGAVLPGWILFWCASFVDGPRRAVRLVLRPRYTWILFFAIALPWYLLAIQRGGASFAERQLVFENLKRLGGGENMNSEAWWFYLPSFIRTALPWSLIFLAPCSKLFSRVRRKGVYPFSERDYRLRLLPIIWVAAGMVLFSIPAGKRHSYLAPLFPGMAAAVAFFLNSYLRPVTQEGRRNQNIMVAIAVTIGIISLGAICLVTDGVMPLPLKSMTVMTHALQWARMHRLWFEVPCALGALLFFTALLVKGRHRGLALASGTIAVIVLATTLGLGLKADLKGFNRMAEGIRSLAGSEPIVVYKGRFDEYLDPVLYYLSRPVEIVNPPVASIACRGFLLGREVFIEDALDGVDDIGEHTLIEKVATFAEISPSSKSGQGLAEQGVSKQGVAKQGAAKQGTANGKQLALFRCLVPVLEPKVEEESMNYSQGE